MSQSFSWTWENSEAIYPFGGVACSKEAKALVWLLMGAPRTMPSAGGSTVSCLPLSMLRDQAPRGSGSGAGGDEKMFRLVLQVPKEAVGLLIGSKGSSKRAIEEQAGGTFDWQTATDPAELLAKGSLVFLQELVHGRQDGAPPQVQRR